jgi:hypothetical protein
MSVLTAHVLLNVVIARMPKPIPLDKDESEAFDKAFTALAKKYYSDIQKFGEEFNFVIATGLTLVPRMEFKKKKKSEDVGTKNNSNIRSNGNGQEHVDTSTN